MRSHDAILPGFAALSAQIDLKLQDKNSTKTAFEIGHNFEGNYYEWAEGHPEAKDAFHRFMETQFAQLPSWLSEISYEKDFAGPALTEHDVAFVDVGGGIGQQCQQFREELSHIPARIILQDRESVVANALNVEGMETMGYDYLKTQPVDSKYSWRDGNLANEANLCRCAYLLLPPDLPQQHRRKLHQDCANALGGNGTQQLHCH